MMPVKMGPVVRGAAHIIGCFLMYPGWAIFAIGVLYLALEGPTTVSDAPFRVCTPLLLPGWLLLRFAAGLFPFSRRFSRYNG